MGERHERLQRALERLELALRQAEDEVGKLLGTPHAGTPPCELELQGEETRDD
jgi:hypothetical protein